MNPQPAGMSHPDALSAGPDHSEPKPIAAAPPHPLVQAIPAFKDNYIWLILDPERRCAALVDPGDGEIAHKTLLARGLRLSDVLITHHHADHIGGLAFLRQAWPNVRIHGPDNPKIVGIDHVVRPGEHFQLPEVGLSLQAIGVPGHTLDHLAFGVPSHGTDPRPLLFCGDTLFAGGCGRLFEGSASQMHQSLSALAAWPPETLIYCAHEDTESNLRFAHKVDPDNPALRARAHRVAEARAMP